MEINKVSLKNYSSLHIGGEGDMLVIATMKELTRACMFAQREQRKIVILGGGTNTYFGTVLENILVLKIEIKGISLEEREDLTFITAHAGEVWDDLVQFCETKNLWGIENLSYIPGTVGAAPVQNIGAYGVELKDTLVTLSALDTKTMNSVEISNHACEFGYRDSLFKRERGRYIIISITLKLSKSSSPALSYKPLNTLLKDENLTPEVIRNLVITTRKAKLPDWKEYPNAGSFFKNAVVSDAEAEGLRIKFPEIPLMPHLDGYKIPAAWLIEHIAHMKGVRVGDIGIWPNQPLVLINYGDATAKELNSFARNIIDLVKNETGITLEKEVNFVE